MADLVLNSTVVHRLIFVKKMKICASISATSPSPNNLKKSSQREIFANDGSASRTAVKTSLLSHDALPTVAFEAFRKGVNDSFRNDDNAERSLYTIQKNLLNKIKTYDKNNY